MDFTSDLTKLKLRKSQFNLSVSLTPGELSAIFDSTSVQPQSNSKFHISYSLKKTKHLSYYIFAS